MRRVRVSPRPVPSTLRADLVPCWKESKIRSWSAGAIPTPVSETVTSRLSGSRVAATTTLPPSAVNFTALLRRLSSTCLKRSSSALSSPSPGGISVRRAM